MNDPKPTKIYVLGFAFDEYLSRVLLINKVKPDWQKGLLNGVGGKLEPNETVSEGMVREFFEETGFMTWGIQWDRFAVMRFEEQPDVRIVLHCFTAQIHWFEPRRDHPSGEVARWRSAEVSHQMNVIPNLNWLVPMARLRLANPAWEEHCEISI